MNKSFCKIVVVFLLLVASQAYSKNYEVLKSTDSLFQLAKHHVVAKEYESANNIFLEIFSTKVLLPDDVSFYFGKSLYHVGSYNKIAIDFLKKYLQLKGDSAEFKVESEKMLENMGVIIRVKKLNKNKEDTVLKEVKKSSETCQVGEFVLCPICEGTNLISKQAAFGSSFQECEYCNESGNMPCENNEKYLEEGILLKYNPK